MPVSTFLSDFVRSFYWNPRPNDLALIRNLSGTPVNIISLFVSDVKYDRGTLKCHGFLLQLCQY